MQQETFPQETFALETRSARKRRLAAEFNQSAEKPGRSLGSLTATERSELNALSKEVFGATSRWQKLINGGYSKLLTEKVREIVPAAKAGDRPTEREIEVPLKRHDGATQSTMLHHTVESVRTYMLQRKEQLDAIRAQIKKQQDEARAKKEQEKLALKVHEELQGSAL